MKIVASTKLARAQKAMTESRSYGQTSNTVFENAETKPVEGDGKKSLIVVASSDKGLCGGVHSGLSKKARKILLEKPDTDIVVIGEKSKSQLTRSNGKNIVLSFAGLGKNVPTFADAQAIADQISLLPTDYASVQIIYNKFINATSYEPTPIEAFSEEAIANSRKHPRTLELSDGGRNAYEHIANFSAFEIEADVLANLREYALANSLYWVSTLRLSTYQARYTTDSTQALVEGHACEISARRNAMDVSLPSPSLPLTLEARPRR